MAVTTTSDFIEFMYHQLSNSSKCNVANNINWANARCTINNLADKYSTDFLICKGKAKDLHSALGKLFNNMRQIEMRGDDDLEGQGSVSCSVGGVKRRRETCNERYREGTQVTKIAMFFISAWDKEVSSDVVEKYRTMFNTGAFPLPSNINEKDYNDEHQLIDGYIDPYTAVPVSVHHDINDWISDVPLLQQATGTQDRDALIVKEQDITQSTTFPYGTIGEEREEEMRDMTEICRRMDISGGELSLVTSTNTRAQSCDSCSSDIVDTDEGVDEGDYVEEDFVQFEGISEEELTRETLQLMDSVIANEQRKQQNVGEYGDGMTLKGNSNICFYTDFYRGCTKIPLELDVCGDSDTWDINNEMMKTATPYRPAYVTDAIAGISRENIDVIMGLSDLWKQLFPSVTTSTGTSNDSDNNTSHIIQIDEVETSEYQYEPPPLSESDLWWMQRDKKVVESVISVVRSVLGVCGLNLQPSRGFRHRQNTSEIMSDETFSNWVYPAKIGYENVSFVVKNYGEYGYNESCARKKRDFLLSSKGIDLLYRMEQFLGLIGVENAQSALCDYREASSPGTSFFARL